MCEHKINSPSDFDKSFMKTPQTSVNSFRGYLKNQSEFKK